MNQTRREFIATIAVGAGAIGIMMAAPRRAHACMLGTWVVRCPNGHDDTVTRGTCQHVCETCHTQVFSGNWVRIVCPVGHVNGVDTGDDGIDSLKCAECKRECRRDVSAAQRRTPDHDHP